MQKSNNYPETLLKIKGNNVLKKLLVKQEKPVVSYRLSLRFGTDLLSHVLPQYHRLWWA